MKTRILAIAAATAIAAMAGSSTASANDNSSFSWFFGDFWKSKAIEVDGGTIKSGDFETICDKDPKQCGSDADLPSKPKPKPKPQPQ